MPTLTVKASLGDEMRRLRLRKDASYAVMVSELAKLFGFPVADQCVLKYTDEEGDLITMSSDSELREAMAVAPDVLRVTLLRKTSHAPAVLPPQPTATPLPPTQAMPSIPPLQQQVPASVYYPPQQPQPQLQPQQQYAPVYLPFQMRSLSLQRQQLSQMKAGRAQQQHQAAEQRRKWKEQANALASNSGSGSSSGSSESSKQRRGVKHMARFVKDVTVNDGSEFPPNTRFFKTWKFRNESNIPWPPGSELVFVGKRSDRMGSPDAVPVNVVANPGEEVEVTIALQAPQKGGRYIGYWRLRGSDGRKFGQRVWCSIRVPSYSSSSSSSSSDSESPGDPPHEFFVQMSGFGYSQKRAKRLWKKYSDSERQHFLASLQKVPTGVPTPSPTASPGAASAYLHPPSPSQPRSPSPASSPHPSFHSVTSSQ